MPSLSTPAPPDITTLDRSPENAIAALYSAAIEPVNTGYYVPVFARFEADGHTGTSWNWAASLSTLSWMIFRQLWAGAVLYLAAMLGLLLIVFGLGRLLFSGSQASELAWLVACGGLSFLLPGLFGNAVFHARSRQKMAAALSASLTLADVCQRLSQQASTRQRFLWLLSVNLALASLAALAYIAWPVVTVRPLSPGTRPVAGHLAPPVPMGDRPSAGGQPIEASAPASVAAALLASSASDAGPADSKLIVTPLAKTARPADRITLPNASSSPAAGQRFLINVGLFANEVNARNAYTKLHAAGLPVFAQTLKGRTRVRTGPFASQPEAQAAVAKIRALQLDAVMFQP